jgi:hypothetical protein
MRLAKDRHPWPCTYPKGKIIVANGGVHQLRNNGDMAQQHVSMLHARLYPHDTPTCTTKHNKIAGRICHTKLNNSAKSKASEKEQG